MSIKIAKPFKKNTVEDYINAALETEKWISENVVETKSGIVWKFNPESDNYNDAPLTQQKSWYGGAAGIGFFYLRLYKVTKDAKYLAVSEKAAANIIATYEGASLYDEKGKGSQIGIATGFYNGPAGQAFLTQLLYEETGKKEYKDFVDKVNADILGAITETGDTATWSGALGIISDGGLVLYLADQYERTKDEKIVDLLAKVGNYYLTKEEKVGDEGSRYYAMDTVDFGLGENGYFPNFFYGTAGTGYVLAKVYEVTKDERFLTASKNAAKYVISVSDVNEDGTAALACYNIPYKQDIYYLGMCQGPVGSTRLFYKLYKLTGDELYKQWVIKLTNGIIEAGAPAKHSEGYWHTYCYCCGAAGMLEHFLHVYHFTGDKKYYDYALESADVLLRDSFILDDKRRWYTRWTRLIPGDVESYTGLYHGTAGCASSLLVLYSELEGIKNLPEFLENPFK